MVFPARFRVVPRHYVAPVPITFRQQNAGGAVASATNVRTFPASTLAGSCLVVCSTCIGAAITGITGGGTWVLAKLVPGAGLFGEIWICPNATAVTVVTVTYANATWDSAVNVAEYPGVSLTPLDVSANNSGTSTSPTTGSLTPSAAGCVVVGMIATKGAYSSGPTGGFTGLTQATAPNSGNPAFILPGYLIQMTPAAANPGWTIGSNVWDAAAVALRPA